ncbi:hypothetical protein B0H13DRAFT_1858874 [Mycena leptocephala]|nr:hypothetical protein B0H13DRAFT_1858874 [Mycena leptocephala]
MPHVSLRQKLLRGAYKYAAKLQRWRKQEREQHLAEEVEITTGLGIGDDLYDQPLGQDEGEDSDTLRMISISTAWIWIWTLNVKPSIKSAMRPSDITSNGWRILALLTRTQSTSSRSFILFWRTTKPTMRSASAVTFVSCPKPSIP